MRPYLALGVAFYATVCFSLTQSDLRAQANVSTNPGTTYVRPPFVSGVVVLADGTPLPGPVPIERVCGLHVYRETFTDANGLFGVLLGQNQQDFTDAANATPATKVNLDTGRSAGDVTSPDPRSAQQQSPSSQSQPLAFIGAKSPNDLADCELRASLPGYHSESVMLGTRRGLESSDVGTIILTYMGESKGSTISVTTALAPKGAQKSFDKGVEASHSGRFDLAQKELLKAVQVYPKYAEAWFELGGAYEHTNQLPDAKAAYTKAVQADANYPLPYERLYILASKEQKWQEVANATQQLLRLSPVQFPGAYYYDAVANLQLGKLDAAEKSARAAAKLTGRRADPRSLYVLGLVLSRKGDFAGAAESLRDFLQADPNSANKDRAQTLLAEAEAKIAGR